MKTLRLYPVEEGYSSYFGCDIHPGAPIEADKDGKQLTNEEKRALAKGSDMLYLGDDESPPPEPTASEKHAAKKETADPK